MGCGCGGAREDQYFLVTAPDGGRRIVRSEIGARLAVTLAGGGVWREIDVTEAMSLQAEGVEIK